MLCSIILCFSIFPLTKTCLADQVATVYIRADGSIEPPSAPLLKQGDIYTFTGNLTCDGIQVERENVALDGNGYWLEGAQGKNDLWGGIFLYEIRNVTVRNSQVTGFSKGILMWNAFSCTVIGSNFTDCYEGIHFQNASNNCIIDNTMNLSSNGNSGLYLLESSGNILSGNNITGGGIECQYGSDNTITQNTVSGGYFGIQVFSGSNITLKGNKMIGNQVNFDLQNPFDDIHVDSSNMLDDKRVYYWIGETSKTIPLDAGTVFLVNCSHITIQNLNISNVGEGITLANTTDTIIRHNSFRTTTQWAIHLLNSLLTDISNNSLENAYWSDCIVLQNSNYSRIIDNSVNITGNDGIVLKASSYNEIGWNNISQANYEAILLDESSNNNTVFGNRIEGAFVGIHVRVSHFDVIFGNTVNTTGETSVCIFLEMSSNNLVYHNNILKIEYPIAGDTESSNEWDNGYPSGGNFWLGFLGTDSNNDGTSDIPFNFYQNCTDHFPLMAQYVIPEFPTFLLLPFFMIGTILMMIDYKRKHLTRAL